MDTKTGKVSPPRPGAAPLPDKDAAFLESISPLKNVDRIVDPLFVHADAMVSENEGHSLARKENLVEFLSRSARFLE